MADEQNKSWMYKNWYSRGMFSGAGPQLQTCKRTADGDLYVACATHERCIDLYKSTDNGYSWDLVVGNAASGALVAAEVSSATSEYGGPCFHLEVAPQRNVVLLLYYNYDDNHIYATALDYDAGTAYIALQVTNTASEPSEGIFVTASNDQSTYVVYVYSPDTGMQGDVVVRRIDHEYLVVKDFAGTGIPTSSTAVGDLPSEDSYDWLPTLAACVDEDNNLDVLCEADNDDGASNHLYHMRATQGDDEDRTMAWGTPVEIGLLGSQGGDVQREGATCVIDYDGNGTLGIAYCRYSNVETIYGYSVDSGATWNLGNLAETGYSDHTDAVDTSVENGWPDIMGGVEGFILSMTYDNSSDVATPWLYLLETEDSGSTYTLDDGRLAVDEASDVPWVKFFKPEAGVKMSLDRPKLARIAYQIGEEDASAGYSDSPVSYKHQLLEEYAFTPSSDYTVDTSVGSSQIVVGIDILGGVNSNVDYYDEGVTGSITDRYMKIFETNGTYVILKKYEPIEASQMADITAYEDAVESAALVNLDPESYEFPTPSLASSETTDWIEQDIRKVWLPADKHISRTWVVNAGNHAKRTVWVLEYAGNEYEISQVVPRFIRGQIVYYEANCYVIGPSRNPFTRTVLPSET